VSTGLTSTPKEGVANLLTKIDDKDEFDIIFDKGAKEVDLSHSQQLKSEATFFLIGVREFEYNAKDPIFFKSGPTNKNVS
jgi:hypothetical protein